MMRLFLVTVLVAVLGSASTSAQEAVWCRAFDFLTGQQGWQLSYNDQYGRYTQNAGFSVTDYGNTTSYELGGSIRIHLDFSGVVRQIYIYSAQPDLTHVFVDWDSSISDAEPMDDDIFTVGAASPVGLSFNPQTVSGRLGFELVSLNEPLPMTTVVTGIALTGTGANPFGSDNCADSIGTGGTGGDVEQLYEVGIAGPFAELFAAMANANGDLGTLPTDLSAPGGLPILPASNPTSLFAYAKWLLSPAAADEYAGPFAPIIQHIGFIVTAAFGLILAYVGVYLLVYIVRFVLWLAKWLLNLMSALFAPLSAAGNAIISGARALLSAISR